MSCPDVTSQRMEFMLAHRRVSHARWCAFDHMGVKILLKEHNSSQSEIKKKTTEKRPSTRFFSCQWPKNINKIWALWMDRHISCKPSCSNCWRLEIKENISQTLKSYRITASSKAVLIQTEIERGRGMFCNLFTYLLLAKNKIRYDSRYFHDTTNLWSN